MSQIATPLSCNRELVILAMVFAGVSLLTVGLGLAGQTLATPERNHG